MCGFHSSFNHFSRYGHWHSFPGFAITHNAAMDSLLHMHFYLVGSVCSQSKSLERTILDKYYVYMYVVLLVYWKFPSRRVPEFAFPAAWERQASHSLEKKNRRSFLIIFTNLMKEKCKCYLNEIFIFISLIMSEMNIFTHI